MQLRRLTTTGIERFSEFLRLLQADGRAQVPVQLLTDEEASAPVADVDVPARKFASRLEASQFFYGYFKDERLQTYARDVGVWAWLSLFYFDEICPLKSGGMRKPSRESFRYIPATDNFRKYYRHLLFGPYVIYESHMAHIDEALALLVGPVHVIGDVIEQIASRLERISNRAVVAAATSLYVDRTTNGYKPGSGGKGGGSPRRLSEVLDQFDLTYDLYGMQGDGLLRLLPREFDRFRR